MNISKQRSGDFKDKTETVVWPANLSLSLFLWIPLTSYSTIQNAPTLSWKTTPHNTTTPYALMNKIINKRKEKPKYANKRATSSRSKALSNPRCFSPICTKPKDNTGNAEKCPPFQEPNSHTINAPSHEKKINNNSHCTAKPFPFENQSHVILTPFATSLAKLPS